MRGIVIISVVVGLAAAGAFTSVAQGYDRQPINVSGLKADDWGQTITGAQRALKYRYPAIHGVQCYGVKSSWSKVFGNTRYWDKAVCFGALRSGTVFGLIFDAKGRDANAFTIYRVSGVDRDALEAYGVRR